MATISDALAIAFQHHQAGRLDLAEKICARILQVEPNQVDALHLLGVVANQMGQHEAAIEYIARAIELVGTEAVFHNSLGMAFKAQGKLDEAVDSYRRAVELRPDYTEAHNNLGNALKAQGKLDEAVASYRRTLELRPELAETHYNLGNALREQGQFDEAVDSYRRAVERKPDLAEAYNNLGIALAHRGKLDEAVDSYRRALELNPHYAEACDNLGLALQEQGKLVEAAACYRRVLELKPDDAEAHNNLGNALTRQGKLDEAVDSYRRALERNPRHARASYNLGMARQEQGKLDEAVASYRRALELQPDLAEAHNNLGNALKDQGNLDEAVACYQRAIQLRPDFVVAHDNLLFALEYRGGLGPAGLAHAYAEFDRRHAAPLRSAWRPHGNRPDPDRPLRLGFLSADFGRAPVGHFYLRPLECLRAEDCHIACYSTRTFTDDIAARFRAATHVWRDVSALSDEALAEQIRADEVDILFELSSHAAWNRLLVFARKPAPIQVAWAGPTGLSAMDYVLSDRYLIPPGAELDYRERVLRMPDAFVCYGPPAAAPAVGPLPALERGYVTLGSLNSLAKITPQVLETWAHILRRLPVSRLVVQYFAAATAPTTRSRWCGCLADAGIDERRVEMIGRVPRRWELYQQIDLALDPFPFSGSTTTCEALWMGVPVITLPGQNYYSRQSLTMLRNVGFDPPVARDLQDYVDRAVALAEDLPRLAARRAGLRQRIAASPLCDGPRFAANLMQVLRGAWRDWCHEIHMKKDEHNHGHHLP